jgi:phosphoglucosamine mutase
MSKKLFGTDGIRGVANQVLTPELAFKIGQAAGRWMIEASVAPRVAMGRDTRLSGTMLGASLASGFNSAGVSVTAMGVVPTGGVSFITRARGYGLGAVISASHNPAPDNGIKLIAASGSKISDEAESWIEEQIGNEVWMRPTGGAVGSIENHRLDVESYEEWLVKLCPEGLQGMKIAMDCSHGSAYQIAPEVFRRLGAEVHEIGAKPNGMNINDEVGATSPKTVQGYTQEIKAHIGIAFDGDADRAVFSDDQGRLINGDRMMAIWCAHWKKEGRLVPSVCVGTVMSNMGFERYMLENGIALQRTKVGDKYVSQMLASLTGKIGGEQSGHIIIPENGPTGDGLATAIELLRVLKREDRPASSFFNDFANWPQLLINVQVKYKDGWEEDPVIISAIQDAEMALEGRGRVNVRASGTQPMIRVMVEADDQELRDTWAGHVVAALTTELGGDIYSKTDLTYDLGD